MEEQTQLQPAAGGNEENMYEDQKVRTALRNQSTVKNEETAEKSKAEREEGMKHIEDLHTQRKVRQGVANDSIDNEKRLCLYREAASHAETDANLVQIKQRCLPLLCALLFPQYH